MDTVKIPEGYQRICPYLIIPDAAGFMHVLKDVFGATERNMTMRDENIIMHAEAVIGDSVIMFADTTEQFAPCTAGLFIYVANADETYKKALEAGAATIMPPADQPYGRSCGVTDKAGNTWWITSVQE